MSASCNQAICCSVLDQQQKVVTLYGPLHEILAELCHIPLNGVAATLKMFSYFTFMVFFSSNYQISTNPTLKVCSLQCINCVHAICSLLSFFSFGGCSKCALYTLICNVSYVRNYFCLCGNQNCNFTQDFL
jgi:hypothetical protein